MDKIIKKILKKIENNGYEAYLVGGFVRDTLLGKITYDVDICTNARPKEIVNIFPKHNSSNNYGGVNIKFKKYNIDITTYRKELCYENRKPTEIEYIDNLIEDLKRRDFTINSVCMDADMNIIDLMGGVDDINNHLIKMIGDSDKKLKEDPLRMLRAIRFSCINNFKIDDTLYKAIKDNAPLVKSLSKMRIKAELNKILLSENYMKGLDLLKDTGILKCLNISYEEVIYVSDIHGMWAQLSFNDNYEFTKQEKENITKIKEIVNIGYINKFILYEYGLYLCQVAGEIIGIPKNKLNTMFNNLPITNREELDITGSELLDILNIEPSKKLSYVFDKLISLVLEGKLKNNKDKIKLYVINNKEELLNE